MDSSISFQNLRKNSGRRTGADRRHFSYAFYIPERRNIEGIESGKDRRRGLDRRANDKPLDPNKTPFETHNEEMQ